MSTKTTYRQCRLERKTPTGSMTTVSYIPTKFARVGRILSLKGDNGEWVDDWKVTITGAEVATPPDWRKLIRGHRKQTGDNLPKNTVRV